jgi:hypothetical protein
MVLRRFFIWGKVKGGIVMKIIILITIFCLIVPCPANAQEEDVLESVERPAWSYRWYSPPYKSVKGKWVKDYVGFHDGHVYPYYRRECFDPDTSYPYINLLVISLFGYERMALGPDKYQWVVGILFHFIGIGIQWCIPVPCPLVGNMLVRVPGKSLPTDFCP